VSVHPEIREKTIQSAYLTMCGLSVTLNFDFLTSKSSQFYLCLKLHKSCKTVQISTSRMHTLSLRQFKNRMLSAAIASSGLTMNQVVADLWYEHCVGGDLCWLNGNKERDWIHSATCDNMWRRKMLPRHEPKVRYVYQSEIWHANVHRIYLRTSIHI